ncbi:ATP-binding protein [Mariprofundus sp. KV]|uniref:ATP-binding protein n=1 Tax=Mariprofundus sp. KV TaxID=2608715 RepID=UPI0015A1326A|nr:ATP-binding protein [Mariprofundus sp. KV]NWF35405.1 response regulator [Mariprofundus sp. KV]
MSIRHRLQLLILLFITAGVTSLGLQEWSHRVMETSIATEHTIDTIERKAYQLSMLTTDIAATPKEQRAQQQWQTSYQQLQALLLDAQIQSVKGTQQPIIQLRKSMSDMQLQLQRLIKAGQEVEGSRYFQVRLNRELRASMLQVQSIISHATTMRNIIDEHYTLELHNIRTASMLITATAIILLVLLAGVMLLRIIRALNILKSGISRFAAGDLHEPIRLRSKDELAEVAASLNSMAHSLTDSMASRDQMEEIIKERTDALQKSRLAAISVMEDINIQRHQTEEARQALETLNSELQDEVKIRKAKESELRRKEALLRQAKSGAEQASRSKSIFLANMSHELRTPLNAILGFSQLLQMDPAMSEASKANLQTINRSGAHLLTLINDVLDMSKIEAGKIDLQNDSFNFDELIREAIDMMVVRASSKGISLGLDADSNYPKFIYADAAKIRQILINLLSNAVKFTEQGAVSLHISTEAPNEQGEFTLTGSVTDSGIGIAAKDLDKVFAPFEQIVQKGEEKIDQKGTGLGLSLCKQFIEMMDGHIEVQSKLNEGSTFTFSIRVKEATASEIEEITPATKGLPTGLAAGQKAIKVLIAEDDTANAIILESVLRKAGLQTLVVANGEEAIAQFKAWKPDLICMDRRMPVMDGKEATRHIRQEPGGGDVKIIAVTAVAFREERQQMFDAGCDDLVKKPYAFEEIFQAIERNIEIEFSYPGGEDARQPADTEKQHLDKDDFAAAIRALPAALIKRIQQCALELDMDGFEATLPEVEAINPQLAESLRNLHRQLDYSAILKVLEENGHG